MALARDCRKPRENIHCKYESSIIRTGLKDHFIIEDPINRYLTFIDYKFENSDFENSQI